MPSRLPVAILGMIAITLGTASALALYWLKLSYPALEQIRNADAFVQMLRSENYVAAYEATFKNRLIGTTLPDFERFARRQVCGNFYRTEIFPPQTNGNRVRRWLLGVEIDMPEVGVQYEGTCFFKITFRRTSDDAWKVYNFGSHSG